MRRAETAAGLLRRCRRRDAAARAFRVHRRARRARQNGMRPIASPP